MLARAVVCTCVHKGQGCAHTSTGCACLCKGMHVHACMCPGNPCRYCCSIPALIQEAPVFTVTMETLRQSPVSGEPEVPGMRAGPVFPGRETDWESPGRGQPWPLGVDSGALGTLGPLGSPRFSKAAWHTAKSSELELIPPQLWSNSKHILWQGLWSFWASVSSSM